MTQLLMTPLDWISRLAQWRNLRRDCSFDQLSGVDTLENPGRDPARVLPAELPAYAQTYVPTSVALFRRIVRTSRVVPADFAFVDLGSGKGRTLLLASSCGFSRVVGIEADERLCRISRENVNRWAARHSGILPTIIQADARDALFPPGNLFVFMFNPFTGPLFDHVAERLGATAAEEGRALIVAYHNDICAEALERTGSFRRVRLRPLRFWTRPSVSLFYNRKAWAMRRGTAVGSKL